MDQICLDLKPPPNSSPEETQAWDAVMGTMSTFIEAFTNLLNTVNKQAKVAATHQNIWSYNFGGMAIMEGCVPESSGGVCGTENNKGQAAIPSLEKRIPTPFSSKQVLSPASRITSVPKSPTQSSSLPKLLAKEQNTGQRGSSEGGGDLNVDLNESFDVEEKGSSTGQIRLQTLTDDAEHEKIVCTNCLYAAKVKRFSYGCDLSEEDLIRHLATARSEIARLKQEVAWLHSKQISPVADQICQHTQTPLQGANRYPYCETQRGAAWFSDPEIPYGNGRFLDNRIQQGSARFPSSGMHPGFLNARMLQQGAGGRQQGTPRFLGARLYPETRLQHKGAAMQPAFIRFPNVGIESARFSGAGMRQSDISYSNLQVQQRPAKLPGSRVNLYTSRFPAAGSAGNCEPATCMQWFQKYFVEHDEDT